MTIGYLLNGSDNDSFMLEDDNIPESSLCLKCKYLSDAIYHNPFFKLKRKTLIIPSLMTLEILSHLI
jgi:hypothetical protein